MKIVAKQISGSHKTGSIYGLTKAEINAKLGIKPHQYDDEEGDGKVAYEWSFTADGDECAIWDWKGSGRLGGHSTFGLADTFRKIFGANYRAGQF